VSTFLSTAWWKNYQDLLNSDIEWQESARWFEARIEFVFGEEAVNVDILPGGRVVSVNNGKSEFGADISLVASRSEWEKLYAGGTDFYQATSPGLGDMALEGNAALAMRNAKTMWLMLEVMKRVDQAVPTRPAPSPEPNPSGHPTVGRYVNVNGIRTYYEEAGSGPVIVCFHAACQDTMMYRHVLDGLSDKYRVISLDAPGHGKTLMPEGGPFQHLTRHAEFNEAFIAALGIDKPAIIGCSMGGNMVLEMAARRPNGYAAIISSEGADYTPTVSALSLSIIKSDGHQLVAAWSRSMTGNRTPADRAAEVVWQIQRNTAETMAGDLTGYAGFDMRKEMSKILDPVLMLRGDADWLVGQQATDDTASRITGARIAVLAGTGHYPMIENPFEFNQIVRDFLSDVAY
jgi:pimeloyl-ACP methyl ester carboxylesterase